MLIVSAIPILVLLEGGSPVVVQPAWDILGIRGTALMVEEVEVLLVVVA